jgi:hypothetical protein
MLRLTALLYSHEGHSVRFISADWELKAGVLLDQIFESVRTENELTQNSDLKDISAAFC